MTAIASGKGGVGKTVLAASLAQALARDGARVLLFDGDLGMANLDVQLGLAPVADLAAVMAGRAPLSGAVTPLRREGMARMDVIAGRSGCGALAGLPPEQVSNLAAALAALALSYDHVLVDLASGAAPSLLRLAGAADDVLVVLTAEPTALTDAYAFVKMLRLRDEGAAPAVAVNLVESDGQGRRVFDGFAKTCRAFLDFDPAFAGAVRRDAAIPAAIRRQQGLFEYASDCAAASDIARLARHLADSPALCAA